MAGVLSGRAPATDVARVPMGHVLHGCTRQGSDAFGKVCNADLRVGNRS